MLKILLLISFYASQSVASIPLVKSLPDLQEAAREKGKPILIYATGPNCGVCIRMNKEVLVDNSLQNYLFDEFVVFSLDLKIVEHKELYKKLGFNSIPNFLMLDSSLNYMHSIGGFHSPKDLIKHLEKGKYAYSNAKILDKLASNGNTASDLLHIAQDLKSGFALDSLTTVQIINKFKVQDYSNLEVQKFIWEHGWRVNPRVLVKSSFHDYIIENYHEFVSRYGQDQVDVRLLISLDYYASNLSVHADEFDNILTDLHVLWQEYPDYLPLRLEQGTVAILVPELIAAKHAIRNACLKNVPLTLVQYLKQVYSSEEDWRMAYLASFISQYCNDKELLNHGMKLISKSIDLNPLVLYYKWKAELLIDQGKIKEAYTVIEEGLQKGIEEFESKDALSNMLKD